MHELHWWSWLQLMKMLSLEEAVGDMLLFYFIFYSGLWVQSCFLALDRRADPELSSFGNGTRCVFFPRPCCWLLSSSFPYSTWSLVTEFMFCYYCLTLFFFFFWKWKLFGKNPDQLSVDVTVICKYSGVPGVIPY